MAANTSENRVSKREDRRLRLRTMRFSVAEGGFSLVSLGLQVAFFVPFINALGASNLQVGLGASLPSLMIVFAQFISPRLLYWSGSYKRYNMVAVFVHGICYLPLAALCLWPARNPVWTAIAVLSLASIPFGLQMSSWGNWMSHIVPRRRRGKYFAKRNMFLTSIQLTMTITSGILLDSFGAKVLLMFAVIWTMAFAGRALAAWMFAFHYEPPELEIEKHELSFFAFLRGVPSSMFGRFAITLAFMNFGVNLAVPFFPIHMLNNLEFSYTQMSILLILPTFMGLICLRMWGRISDRIGYVIPLRICSLTIAALPLTWVLTTRFWILFINQAVAGVAWIGFNMIAFNYLMSALDRKNRQVYFAYQNVLNHGCLFAGSIVAGLIADHLPRIAIWPLQTIFILSGMIRLASQVLFWKLKDVERYPGPTSTLERIFFDPRWFGRTGLGRFTLGTWRRPF